MYKIRPLLVLLAASQLLWSSFALAQTPKGTIEGTAVDANQGPLPGALVTVTPGDKKTATDSHGTFRVPDVAPGAYDVTVSYVGFTSFISHVTVNSGAAATVAAVLQVASVSDQVLVTAERPQGDAAAINIERTADNIVQVLPWTVITSLPNTNIADAVGRLPSVTLERDEGEGKYVQIRGTEPRLSNVTINGVHVPSPEATVRNIKLDAVPSDIVDRIEVNKTLSANQDGDTIGGSVNLVTKTPGSIPLFTVFARGGFTPIQDGRTLDGLDVTAGRRFGDHDQLGVLFGGTYDQNNRGIDDMEPTQAIGTIPGQAPFAYIANQDLRTYQYDRKRYGFDGDVDYAVRPGFNVYAKGLYSDFHDFGSTFVYTPNAGNIVSNSGPTTTFDNTGNMLFREYIRRPDQGVWSIATGGANVASASNVVGYQFAVSRGHNDGGQDFPTTNFTGPQNITFALDESDPLRPILRPTDGTNIFDPSQYTVSATEVPSYQSAELDFEGSGALTHSYQMGSRAATLEIGANLRDAHKTQAENDQFFNATGTIPMTSVLSGDSNPTYYDGFYNGYGPLTDYTKIQDLLTPLLGSSAFSADANRDRIVSDAATWNTREQVGAGYIMNTVTFNKFTLQAGVRIEATNNNYHANEVTLNNGAYANTSPVTGSDSYVNALPSVQLRYALSSDTTFRLAYGWGIARPNFQDLVPAVQVDPNASPKSVQVGNPALLPTRAINYDALIEHYFEPLGILQGGVFYKSLKNPIYATASFLPGNDPNFPGFLRQESINGPSAYIAGFETAWQQRLSALPGLLKGFGVSANYSWTTSQVTFPAGFSSAVAGGEGRIDHPALQRQAPNTWNLGLTYDYGRVSARLGISHNDANIYAYQYVHNPTVPNVDSNPILGIAGPLGDQYLYAHTQVDVQGSYRMLKGWELVVSGLNLTNEVFGFFTGSPIYPNQREFYKATLIVGMRWDPMTR
jgi:TonB-dependent receptor